MALFVRRLMVGSLVATAALLLLGIALGTFGEFRTRLLLTTLGLFMGATLAHIELKALAAWPKLSRTALGLLATSQVLYYLLVWGGARSTQLQLLWWLAMVASVTAAHLIALFLPGDPKQNWWNTATAACAVLCGVWFACLGFPPGDLTPLRIGLFLPPALGSTFGSIQVWRRRIRKDGPPKPLPFWARAAWVVGSVVGAFGLGWYLGNTGHQSSAIADMLPSALSGLSAEQVRARVKEDVGRLQRVSAELDALSAKVAELEKKIHETQARENRTYYKPEEDDQVRWAFVAYLSQRAALNALAATYASYEAVREPELRAACFMTGLAAGASAFEAGLAFVWMYRDNETVRRKLNEAEPRWGLKAGMFDRIYDSVSDTRNLGTLEEMSKQYAESREHWLRTSGPLTPDELNFLDVRIRRGRDYVKTHAVSQPRAWLSRLTRQVKQDSYKPIYTAQSALSIWIGDTRITADPPAITHEQIQAARSELRPGDIILERRNWFLSNAFLPGFWPHGALYVGTVDDIRRLGLAEHPDVKSRLAAFSTPDEHGELPSVIESVSEGVIFNTLSHSIHADHVAVFRPRKLSQEQIGQAILRAFGHVGKPYDFEFDFFSSDKLVCTELVYRAYEGFLHFDLVRVMGRDTLPALEIARKFSKELSTPSAAELDFVLMLDALPGEQKAARVGPAVLIESIDREKSFGR